MQRRVAVIGRGTVGILSLMELLTSTDVEVTCIFDESVPVTSVGEATSYAIPFLLKDSISNTEILHKVIKSLGATARVGTEFKWKDSSDDSRSFNVPYGNAGMHLDASKFSSVVLGSLTEEYPERLSLINERVHKVKDRIINNKYAFDLIIDCSGTPSASNLKGDKYTTSTLNTVDSVLLHQRDACNPDSASTVSTFHRNGWMFTVPLKNRDDFGYLYNSKVTSRSDAQKDFEALVPSVKEGVTKHLTWGAYYKNTLIENGVVSLGNSLYFFEPSHAVPLHFFARMLENVTHSLDAIINSDTRSLDKLNALYREDLKQVELLISLSYTGDMGYTSKFWREIPMELDKKLNKSEYYKEWCESTTRKGMWTHTPELMSLYLEGLNIAVPKHGEITDMKNTENSTFINLEPFPYILTEGSLTPSEMESVDKELKFLKSTMRPAELSGSARDADGNPLKRNLSISLKEVYRSQEFSSILKALGGTLLDNFQGPDSTKASDRGLKHWLLNNMSIGASVTMVSYYGEGDYYLPHRDNTVLTAVTFISEEYGSDEGFSGGDLTFTDYDITIPFKHNSTIIFPGCIRHEVSKVHASEGKGRFSIVQGGYVSYEL
jgi:hypothetical protein